MSKVAKYLQGHILGEVTTAKDARLAVSHDGSVLEMTPEMVVYPRTTSDLRKVARFSWQLAEKGHIFPITTRGSGTDQTGAAIGQGMVLVTPAHMNNIFEYEHKQRFVRVQPGANFGALQSALAMQGVTIPAAPRSFKYSTIGGAVANNASGYLSGRYGQMSQYVQQLEVILANGDVIQTGRVSKRDLKRKKEQTDMEGEIYRTVDAIITDNGETITTALGTGQLGNLGYSGLGSVKQRDGSFDLTPLFVGSQGTLGIISEMILKCDFLNSDTSRVVLMYQTKESARDAVDALRALEPASLEYIDASLFEVASARGREYAPYMQALETGQVEAILSVMFDDFNDRARLKKIKKIAKSFLADGVTIVTSEDDALDGVQVIDELIAMSQVTHYSMWSDAGTADCPPLADGIYVPPERFDDFCLEVGLLADKHGVLMPVIGRALDNVFSLRAELSLVKLADRQKYLALVDDVAKLVAAHDGSFVMESGEGRVKSPAAYANLDTTVKQIFADIKNAFDPYGILNPGVKQHVDTKDVAALISHAYEPPAVGQNATYY